MAAPSASGSGSGSGSGGAPMSAASPDPYAPHEATMDAIRKRLVETGDWDRISRALRSKLEEEGFVDDLKDFAKERARQQDQPKLDDLLAEVLPKAQAMLQPSIRAAVAQEIEAVLDRQVEQA